MRVQSCGEANTLLSRRCLIALFTVGATAAVSAAPGVADDACSLITADQVSAATRTPVGDGAYLMPTVRKTCTWAAIHPVAQGVKIVTVSFESLDMFAAGMTAGRNAGVTATPVSGLGDSAYFLDTNGLLGLHVRKGGVALKVAVYSKLPAEQVQTMERALAAEVVSKL
jgi:hypothetical protein